MLYLGISNFFYQCFDNHRAHTFYKFYTANYQVPTTADTAAGNLDSQFPDHLGDVHKDTAGAEYRKVRSKAYGNNRFSCILLAKAVMDLTGSFTRGWEGELMGMDLHIEKEEACIVLEHAGIHVGHTGTHLVGDHGVCPIDQET